MFRHGIPSLLHSPLVLWFALGSAVTVQAQLIQTETRYPVLSDQFSEGSSINWSLRGDNWFANFGGNGPLLPPFGGAPGGVSGGIGFGGGGVSGNIGFTAGQSSSQSISSTSASVTTMDGVPGFISSTVTRPFVTGLTPVVGGYPQAPNYSSQIAQQDQRGRDRVRQSHENLKNRSLQKYLQRAEHAENTGNIRMARANYKRAIKLAGEPLRSELRVKMANLVSK